MTRKNMGPCTCCQAVPDAGPQPGCILPYELPYDYTRAGIASYCTHFCLSNLEVDPFVSAPAWVLPYANYTGPYGPSTTYDIGHASYPAHLYPTINGSYPIQGSYGSGTSPYCGLARGGRTVSYADIVDAEQGGLSGQAAALVCDAASHGTYSKNFGLPGFTWGESLDLLTCCYDDDATGQPCFGADKTIRILVRYQYTARSLTYRPFTQPTRYYDATYDYIVQWQGVMRANPRLEFPTRIGFNISQSRDPDFSYCFGSALTGLSERREYTEIRLYNTSTGIYDTPIICTDTTAPITARKPTVQMVEGDNCGGSAGFAEALSVQPVTSRRVQGPRVKRCCH